MVNPGMEQVIARPKSGKGSFQLRDRSLKSSFCGSVRIPTDIGDSSRYTLPLPAFRLRTDDFSSMHVTYSKTCPRHQEICCKNPFPEMQSFLGFGTRRLLKVGCFIDISGAKTIQKHRSSRQFTLKETQTRQGTQKRRHSSHIFWNSPTFTKFPSENTQKQYYLDYTLWNSLFSSTFHDKRKPILVHATAAKNLQSTEVFHHPFLATFGKQQQSSSPSSGQAHQLTSYMLCKQRNQSQPPRPVTTAPCIRRTSMASHKHLAASKQSS